MTKSVTLLGATLVTLIAGAASATAEIKVNDNLAVSGFAAGSYRNFKEAKTDRFDIDAAKIEFLTNFTSVKGVVSLYYVPGLTLLDDLNVLDAYVSYDAGDGLTLTAGKFLSYLGYEAFYLPGTYHLSYANGDFLAPIPAYHAGVRADYVQGDFGWGAALVDSIYGPTLFSGAPANIVEGDGELRKNAGFEGYVTYTGVKGLTLWAGIAYQGEGESLGGIPLDASQEETTVIDFWASYEINKQFTVAAEYIRKDGYFADGYNWLTQVNYTANDKDSVAVRISSEELDDEGPAFWKYSITPARKVTENLTVRAEVSYYEYDNYFFASGERDTDFFFGVQGIFKF
jgi:hypothetical protein